MKPNHWPIYLAIALIGWPGIPLAKFYIPYIVAYLVSDAGRP